MSDDTLNATAGSALRGLVQRYERLAAEKAETEQAMKDVLAEVKGAGFDRAIFLETVKTRAKDQALVQERGALLTLYLDAAR